MSFSIPGMAIGTTEAGLIPPKCCRRTSCRPDRCYYRQSRRDGHRVPDSSRKRVTRRDARADNDDVSVCLSRSSGHQPVLRLLYSTYTRIDEHGGRTGTFTPSASPAKRAGYGAFDMSTTGPSTVRRPLRIHVQESGGSLDVFIVTESRLRSQPATRQRLSAGLDVSHGATRTDLDRGLQTAQVMLVGTILQRTGCFAVLPS